ncbi:glutathione peroxidase [Bacteriovorax sp. BSW11_IV]|uniref:glutathione peroxidase n=1 Tax=Bacteriovorax sp. BSW11_IV TaxID=1353529 RepID=UPI000389E196|nr:glutathione peroxidase [Bacteriovorax sp. BSW11_IV]EQC44519.1 glutathione peroxidase [Bacteriovorax sp. BSW11_IV]
MKTVYEFKAIDIKGKERSLSEFEGKPLLIVNTASKCGFTPQYKELQDLYKNFEGKVEVLAFPCNQFGAQEPGESEEIQSFCDLTFNVTFPLFSKVDVNGDEAHPLYNFLKESLPGLLGSKAVKWNFTKFLVDKNGVPVKRYAPQVKPSEIFDDIKELL